MQIVVDKIDPQDCPFYVRKSWVCRLPIEHEEGCCKLDTYPYRGELLQGPCFADKGDKECTYCITCDELKRRMKKTRRKNKCIIN